LLLSLLFAGLQIEAKTSHILDWNMLGYSNEKLTDSYWIKRAKKSNSILLNTKQVADSNKRLAEMDSSVSTWQNWPDSLSATQITDKINALSKHPSRALYSQDGKKLTENDINTLLENLSLKSINASSKEQFGLITQRSALRAFPSDLRAFSSLGNTDIDRFQESAVFPGTPVAVLHQSADKKWLFVQSELYAAWVKADAVALANRATVLAYATKTPRLIINGANVRTVFSPDLQNVSDLVLDMGTAFPLLEQWPNTQPINGQGALAAHVIELPTRNSSGLLHIAPVLIARSADVSRDYLPVTRANIILQSFKFLGERYGWGHDYGSRDCSGFVSEIYRSMGAILPRNTSDQAKSPAFDRQPYAIELAREQRLKRVKQLQIGDLIYVPGHVMMVIGHDAYGPWVIHDSHGTGFMQNGQFYNVPSNSVAVAPLLSMAFSADKTYLDAITVVQHIIPRQNP
jgi:cell wall-associated NlpC family hydrolase